MDVVIIQRKLRLKAEQLSRLEQQESAGGLWIDCRGGEESSTEKLLTLGARGPGTSDYMLRTLRSLVKFTWLLIGNNISGTFQM